QPISTVNGVSLLGNLICFLIEGKVMLSKKLDHCHWATWDVSDALV
ncbi:MAG: hypothetical protein JWN25_824, partial [Verrucomicrobiales bacterium]|nr:hypothetical protein [Verrucomicrobiales bacterium]